MNAVPFVLATAFVWLKFQGVQIVPVVSDLSSDLVFKATMATYFWCWIFGLRIDIDHEEDVLLRPPTDKGVIPVGGWVSWVTLVSIFGILCVVRTPKELATVLGAFLLANVITWRYFVIRILKPTVIQLKTEYIAVADYMGLEQLKLVYDDYLVGRWQWMRFTTGFAVIGLVFASAFSNLGDRLAGTIGLSTDLIVSLEILLFVFIMEAWIWAKRFRVKGGLELLADLRAAYSFAAPRRSNLA